MFTLADSLISNSDASSYSSDSSSAGESTGNAKGRGKLAAHLHEQMVVVGLSDEDMNDLPVVDKNNKVISGPSKKKKAGNESSEPIVMSPGVLLPYQISSDNEVVLNLFKLPAACPIPYRMRRKAKRVVISSSVAWKGLDTLVTEILVESNCFNDNFMHYMKVASLSSLQKIKFNSHSASSIHSLVIRNNQSLIDIDIEDDCFSSGFSQNDYSYHVPEEKCPGVFSVMLNYSLKNISIGKLCFAKYSLFSLARWIIPRPSFVVLPNLLSLSIGKWTESEESENGSFCFSSVKRFSLCGSRIMVVTS